MNVSCFEKRELDTSVPPLHVPLAMSNLIMYNLNLVDKVSLAPGSHLYSKRGREETDKHWIT